jgi:hypothetical protein
MRRPKSHFAVPLVLSTAALIACSGDDSQPATGPEDATADGASPTEAGPADATGPSDAGGDATDASQADAGPCPGCVVLASGLVGPESLALNETSAFVFLGGAASNGIGAVFSYPLDGGSPRSLVPPNLPSFGSVGSIAIDSTSLYVADTEDGFVLKLPLGGVPDGGVFPDWMLSFQQLPQGIVVDSTNAYWSSSPEDAGAAIFKYPINGGDGGPPVALASGLPALMGPLALDATGVYAPATTLTGTNPGLILKIPLDGVGAPITLASGLKDLPLAIAVNAAGVFWVDSSAVQMMPLTGIPDGGAPVVLALGASAALAVDSANLYFTSISPATPMPPPYNLGTVTRVPLDGGASTVIATVQDNPSAIALSGTSVAWTNSGPQQAGATGFGDAGTLVIAPR